MKPEAVFQEAVTDLASYCGWKWWHFADSRRDVGGGRLVGDAGAKGFPDLVLAHTVRARLWHVELKTDKGTLSADQIETLRALDLAGGLCFVWRPSDWDAEIEPALTGRKAPTPWRWTP